MKRLTIIVVLLGVSLLPVGTYSKTKKPKKEGGKIATKCPPLKTHNKNTAQDKTCLAGSDENWVDINR